MTFQLSPQSIVALFSAAGVSVAPVLQVISVSKITGVPDKLKLHISDGDRYCAALVNFPCVLQPYSIFRLDQHIVRVAGDKKLVFLSSFTPLANAPGQIGAPTAFIPPASSSIPVQPIPVQPQPVQPQANPYQQQPSMPPSYQQQPQHNPYSTNAHHQPIQPIQPVQPVQAVQHNPYTHQAQQPVAYNPYQQPQPHQPVAPYQPPMQPSMQPYQPPMQPSMQPSMQPYQAPMQPSMQPVQHQPYQQVQVQQTPYNPYAQQPQPQQQQTSAVGGAGTYGQQLQSLNPYGGGPYGQPASTRQGGARPGATGIHQQLVVTPIGGLSLYTSKPTMVGRCVEKTAIKTFRNARGEGQLFSFSLKDRTGEIRLTAFGGAVDRWYEVVQSGGVYRVRGGTVKAANPKFTRNKNLYEVSLDDKTEIEEVQDDGSIPNSEVDKIVSIGDLALSNVVGGVGNVVVSGGANIGEMITIMGVVIKVSPLGKVTIKASGQEKAKRGLTLLDQSNVSIELTLWGESAETVDEQHSVGRVLLSKGVRLSDFAGKSVSTVGSSVLEWDPVMEAAYMLKQAYDQGRVHESQALTSSSSMDSSSSRDSVVVNVQAMSTQDQNTLDAYKKNANYHVFHGVLSSVVTREISVGSHSNLFYRSCTFMVEGPTGKRMCGKKADQGDHKWMCIDGHEMPQSLCKFIVSAKFADATGEQFVRVFDEEAKKLLGISAEELNALESGEQERKQQALVEAAMFRPYILKVRSKMDKYQDEERISVTAVEVKTLTTVEDAKWMLNFINKFATNPVPGYGAAYPTNAVAGSARH